MTYSELFSGSNAGVNHIAPSTDLSATIGEMQLDLVNYELEDARTETAMASLEALDALITVNLVNGAPQTAAEKMYAQLATMQLFGGQHSFEEITEGYSIEAFADADQHGYAMESLKRRAQGIWAWIKQQVAKLWKIIEAFFYRLFGAIPGMRKKANALRKRIEAAQGKNKEETKMEIDDRLVTALADGDGSPITTASPIISNLESCTSVIVAAEKTYYDKLDKLGKEIENALSSADPENTDYLDTINNGVNSSGAMNAIATIGTNIFGNISVSNFTPSGKDTRFTGRSAKYLKLFANTSLFASKILATEAKEGDDALSPLRLSQITRSTRVELRETKPGTKKQSSKTVDVWDLSDCEKLADHIDKFCDVAESIQRGAEKGAIKKTKEKLDKTGEKFGKAVDNANKRTGDDALPPINKSTAKSALNYVKFYGDMVAKPVPQLIALNATGINAALSVANKSISYYK